MRCLCLALCLLLSVAAQLRAEPVALPGQSLGLLCRAAIATAERGTPIPPHLLAAIARVESGRRDPVSGVWHPWPWAVNAEGQGYFYDTKAQALAGVRAMQARGIRSIDVGCMQINLLHHADAFATLEAAFEPQVNAAYAARFLRELYARTQDWPKAAAAYHSMTPELGADYQRNVMAAWPQEARSADRALPSALARAWGATLTTNPPGFTHLTRVVSAGRIPVPGMTVQSVVGLPPPRRGLDAYRASPVALAYRPPVRSAGG